MKTPKGVPPLLVSLLPPRRADPRKQKRPAVGLPAGLGGAWVWKSVRAEKVVTVHHGAVVEAAIRARGADQYPGFREIDAQRRPPRVEDFALFVQLGLAAHENDQLLRVVALKHLDDLGVAPDRVAAHVFFVLLQPGEQGVDVCIEFRGPGVDT